MAKRTAKPPTETGTPNFEQALKRLETILESLESGAPTLEESLRLYEEGVTLSKQCLETLANAELRLKVLSKDSEGAFRLVGDSADSED